MQWLLLLLIFVPAVEIGVFIWVGSYIGPLWVVGLIVCTGILGITLAKQQGMQTLRRAQLLMSQGKAPGKEIVNGICILVGGIFLLAPGFVSDTIGLFLVLPFTRSLIQGQVIALLSRLMRKNLIVFKRW
ncbi:MAG TPA: FxsA family protein [Candidatus Avamphibacillus intestinigallinarum]|nr:FxsA family protein [Candidatus Avamphibacillus intestinigallinarum]